MSGPGDRSPLCGLRGCKKSSTYCGGPRIASGGVAKGRKSTHVARYTHRFLALCALPATSGNHLATVERFSTASEPFRRWEAFSGDKATLEGADGLFEEIARERGVDNGGE